MRLGTQGTRTIVRYRGPRYPDKKLMKTLEKTMLQTAVAFWSAAGWILVGDAGMLPARFTLSGSLFHWQVFLVLGAIVVAVRDQVQDLRCGCCGNHEDLSWDALWKSREIVCNSCLAWDPQSADVVTGKKAAPSLQPEYVDLFEALKQ
jgi:hypothetical protein